MASHMEVREELKQFKQSKFVTITSSLPKLYNLKDHKVGVCLCKYAEQ